MAYISVDKENSGSVDLYFEDHGSGRPVVLIHGWPLSGASWEKQVPALLDAGYRVITYDRRGFGMSSKPATGYNYDTLAKDLYTLIARLDLHDVALVGFSMGGGEVARYLGAYGSKRIRSAVFMSAITPYLVKKPDNAGGVDPAVFEGIRNSIVQDRFAFLSRFLSDFYNVDELGGKMVSEEAVRSSWNVAANASFKASFDCVAAWLSDFRSDLKTIHIPTLIVHGDADRIVPYAASGKRMAELVKGSRTVVVKGGPHGVNWTHAEEVNRTLLGFLAESAQKKAAA